MSGGNETALQEEGPPGEAAAREATLIDAILRIGASLDLDTVLSEVVENARALTGAEASSPPSTRTETPATSSPRG